MSQIEVVKRLFPESCAYSIGPPESARNTECNICCADMTPEKAVLTHKTCQNAFCAEDLLDWVTTSGSKTLCPMCRTELGELRPANYDPALVLNIVLRNGLTDMRVLIGDEAFSKVPLINRRVKSYVSGYLRADSLDVDDAIFHPAMAGVHDQKWLVDYRGGEHDPEHEKALKDAKLAARNTMNHWGRRGVLFMEEYCVPEFDPHTRIFCPVEPEIYLVDDLELLRELTAMRRHFYNRNESGLEMPPGHWLSGGFRTADLLGMPNVAGPYHILVMFSDTDCSADIQWKLWQPNDHKMNDIYAVPSQPLVSCASEEGDQPYYKGKKRRCFQTVHGSRIYSTNEMYTPDMQADPDLYDLSRLFGPEAGEPPEQQRRPADLAATVFGNIAPHAELIAGTYLEHFIATYHSGVVAANTSDGGTSGDAEAE